MQNRGAPDVDAGKRLEWWRVIILWEAVLEGHLNSSREQRGIATAGGRRLVYERARFDGKRFDISGERVRGVECFCCLRWGTERNGGPGWYILNESDFLD